MTLRAPERRSTRRASVVAALLVAVLLLVGCTPEQAAVRDHANAARRAAGLHELSLDVNLNKKAQEWADHLAAIGRIEHSNVAEGVPPGWRKLGENVGRGPSIEAVHNAFMSSAPHRANILDPAFAGIGTGVAVGADGTVYIVQVFGLY